ncbi:EpsG family protein [Aeromonas veronii]|uniref:EpsG family protein n=1 Tax=Aeromonas veronii TaxID=654 RepID=UPI0034149363
MEYSMIELLYLDEKGLYFLNYVLKIISDEYVFFAISYSVILNSLLLLLYRCFSKELFLLYFALTLSSFIFFQINFNIYRQGLAVILVLLAMCTAHSKEIYFYLFISYKLRFVFTKHL